MKYTNPGILSEISEYPASHFEQYVNSSKTYTKTGYAFTQKNDGLVGWYIDIPPATEIWVSFDCYCNSLSGSACFMYFDFQDESGKSVAKFGTVATDHGFDSGIEVILYDYQNNVLYNNNDKIYIYRTLKHIELHIKTGDDGIFEVWTDNTLLFSFKTSVFSGNIAKFGTQFGGRNWHATTYFSSIILQDTGRIGLEEFKMLTVTPSAAQTIEAGGSGEFTISGLSALAGSNQIKTLGIIAKSKNNDSRITKGEVSFDGAKLGEMDLSSSAETYRQVTSHKLYAKGDIEGKTVTLTVDGG